VVYQYAAHCLRCDGIKVGAALPVYRGVPEEAQEEFVHESGGLQGVARAFSTELPFREPMKLTINDWQEFGFRAPVAHVDSL